MFYTLTALFLLSMIAVLTAQNLGYLWIAMEATTLMSAPLVYYHRSQYSLEATWKYLLLCSVGIAFALFGTVLLFAASQRTGDENGTLAIAGLLARAPAWTRGSCASASSSACWATAPKPASSRCTTGFRTPTARPRRPPPPCSPARC